MFRSQWRCSSRASSISTEVTVRVPGKVNLYVRVGALRPDGYHDLTTVFHAVSLFDEVSLIASPEPSIEVHGEGSADSACPVPLDESNLAWRAVVAVAELAARDPEVRIVLDKTIPVAGGMGGGSADAAATLVGMSALWKLDLSREQLMALAVGLGSDVPFALQGGTSVGTGRGERLVRVAARRRLHWVFALHQRGLVTPTVFRELDRMRAAEGPASTTCGITGTEPILESFSHGRLGQLASQMSNDLQAAAISLEPSLRRTLRVGVEAGAALAGIVSGSGSTCAFLCDDRSAARSVAAELVEARVCRGVRVAYGPVPGAALVK